MNRQFKLRDGISCLAIAALFIPVLCRAQDQDLSAQYTWAPVKIGAGGWMRGMAVSPSDPTRMYARGDVENLYRWNNAAQTWVPTKLASAFPSNITAAPANAGAGAIAIDANNPDHILVAYQFSESPDLSATSPNINLNVYASSDGGVTFKAGNLSLSGTLSSETTGERLAFDPNNGKVAYFGSPGAQGATDGLYRTMDGGLTWTQVTGGGYLTDTSTVRYESQLPRFDGNNGTIKANGQVVSSTIYITYITHDETNADAVSGGGVIRSSDGGQIWTDVTDAAANNKCGSTAQLCWATIDTAGNLWVTDGNSSNNIFKLSRAGAWTTVATPNGGAGGIAVDPGNANRIFTMNSDNMARSNDGGKTWTEVQTNFTYSATQPIVWLRPSSFRPQNHYDSVSGMYFGLNGNLYVNCGNDGVLTTTPNDATDSTSNPPVWSSIAEGIEEMETAAVAIPPGGMPVLGVADESEFTIPDPDTYTALHYPISTWANGGYGLGMSQDIAYAPNAPNLVVAPDANDETSQGTQPQFQYGGYSNDGGNTWTEFPSVANGTHPCILYGGEIAVSARPSGQQGEAPGSDNIVWFPTNAGDPNAQFAQVPAPFYSKNGGTTWTQSTSFNSVSGTTTLTECPSNTSYTYLPVQMGDWLYILAEHQLIADPLTPGTFYLKMTFGNSSGSDGGFWTSTDGGVTWAETAGTTQVPDYTHWGKMSANPNVSGDMWLVDGWGGATSHGLFHTANGGTSFTRSSALTYAWQVALGKAAPGQSYPAIYVYGLLAGDPKWGIFQSVDGGNTFNRISYYPYGIFDIPYDMAASWDVFGTVYVGFSGNSYYYVQYNANDPQASAPAFTPAGGTYQSAQEVTLSSSTPNAAIYYTIDGSTPTTNSNLYGGAIAVSSGSETINALVVASGYSPSSVSSATYTVTPPTAPTGLTATAGNGQVALSWTPSTGATSYNVYEGTASGSESTTPAATGITSASYTVTGLTNGTAYYFTVAAVNSAGTSGASNEASATPLTPIVTPAAPTGLTATAGNGQVALSWTPSTGATSYNVYDGTASGGESATAVATGITSASYTVTGLTNGTAYYFTVAAVNSAGTSGYSNEATATPEPGAYTLSNSGNISVIPGATAGNTSTITVTPSFGFTGTVNLSCSFTTNASTDPASCTLSPTSVTISGATAQTSTLTITTTAPTSSLNKPVKLFWLSAGGTVLALLLFLVPRRRRNWLAMLGLFLLFVFAGGIGCGGSSGGGGGGNSGTTPGSYSVAVTGTSGALSETTTVSLTVN